MKTTRLPSVSVFARRGYSFVELIVSAGAATLLMLGLSSALFLSDEALNGIGIVEERTEAADVQAAMLRDLSQARLFTQRSATSATFQVPDRDADGQSETMTYSWVGSPTNELQYSINGSTTVPLLSNVQGFDFGWASRSMTGNASTPPSMDPNSWGNRWETGGNFGYEDVFSGVESDRRKIIATRVTLDSEQKIISISVYLSISILGNSDVTVAMYGVDNNNNPNNLITNSSTEKIGSSGWTTFGVAPVTIPAGEYYLALSHRDDDASFRYASTGGETHVANSDACKRGWDGSFPNGAIEDNRKISIYATYE
ncbi:hypothetical protein [Thalassoroseus pseudoceratinae]|uniref:hypothetical protein n=1 Tax=Thalassoroseus pseudoceratinae TaxID=2713176 RepID=UPI001421F369|nr:hypothetical protein [Thalassoroseus pseudoceratinae]